MSTNLIFINDALSLIGVIPEGIDATPEQGELALRTANEMVEEWTDDGVVVGWSPQTGLNDVLTVKGNELTAIKHHLAIRLCPHYGREPSPTLVALALSAYAKLQRDQMVSELEPVVTDVPRGEGQRVGWNILTDQ
jgi:hypothetical protein